MLARFSKKSSTEPKDVPLWLFLREGDKDTYWPLSNATKADAGSLSGNTNESHPPTDEEQADIISFSPFEDLEMRAQKRESTSALNKRLMAEAGVRLIAWRQTLGQSSSKREPTMDFRAELYKLSKALAKTIKSVDKAPKGKEGQRSSQESGRGLSNSEWLYATPADRMATTSAKCRIWPGRSILRNLLAQAWSEHPQPQSPYVTGVVFRGEHHTLVVFFKATEAGELESMVSVNLTNSSTGTDEERASTNHLCLEQTLQNYLQHVRLAALDSASEFPADRICLFDSSEFVKQLAGCQKNTVVRPYPAEVEIFGVGVSKWWNVSTQLAVLCLIEIVVTSILAGALILWSKHHSSSEATKLSITNDELKIATIAHWGAITEEGSVPIAKALKLAQELHRDGYRLEIDADRELLRLKVIANVADASNTPTVLTNLMSIAPPESCTRRNPETNTQLSELYITYECTSVDHGISTLLAGNR